MPRESFLNVLEPPIIPLGLEFRKPSAWEIQQHNGYSPYHVKQRKAPDISWWRLRIPHRVVRKKPRADNSKSNLRDYERKRVDQGDVKHVVEERHTPEDDDLTDERAAQALEQWDQRNDWAQCHQ